MAKRHSKAVYRRRQAVALLVVLVPLLIIVKAVFTPGSGPLPQPVPSNTAAAKPGPTKITAAPSVSATPSETPKPTPTTPDCRSSNIKVAVSTDALTYPIGQPVTISMRISNTGAVSCKRDIGALPNEIWVTDADGLVVWSSDACPVEATPKIDIIKPRQDFGVSQVWSGSNSGRDCTSAALDATVGNYFAHARNDTVEAKPSPFTLN